MTANAFPLLALLTAIGAVALAATCAAALGVAYHIWYAEGGPR